MIDLIEEVEGWYSLSVFKADRHGNEVPGTRHAPVPAFKNLITNAGLNRMGTNDDWLNYCQVGSGSTTPVVTDTALASRVASQSSMIAVSSAAQPSAPFYLSNTRTFRFEAGVATGNLSEVGVGWATSGGLLSRALILDTSGVPTTITLLADEVLDVTYQFRSYVPTVDSSGTIVLAGANYNWVGRASSATTSGPANWYSPVSAAVYGAYVQAYNGVIGSITSGPTGDLQEGATVSDSLYSADSHLREGTISFGLSQGNVGGVSAISYKHGIGRYQIGFTPAIPKDFTKVLTLKVRTSWARKTL